jgi:hypothetical protein
MPPAFAEGTCCAVRWLIRVVRIGRNLGSLPLALRARWAVGMGSLSARSWNSTAGATIILAHQP